MIVNGSEGLEIEIQEIQGNRIRFLHIQLNGR